VPHRPQNAGRITTSSAPGSSAGRSARDILPGRSTTSARLLTLEAYGERRYHRRVMPGAPVDVLQRVPLFADLDRREVEQIARSFKERRFPAGETVIKEGSGGAAFFVIHSGEATITVGGKERGMLKPGDYFGEIALLDEGARAATITASSDIVCYGLTLWEFRPLVDQNPAVRWKLLQALARLVREAQPA
jgi:CRP/FNR family transcriptional regulator, cyclic AMP receptor protein